LNKGVNNLHPYKDEQPMNVFKFSLTSFLTATLLVVPIALNFHIDRANAESPGGIGMIKDITEAIADRNPLAPADTSEVSAERQQAILYTVKGIDAQTAGNPKVALDNYGKAVEADPSFGYPYLFVGQLIGDSAIGIECVKFSLSLFKEQNDKDGYNAAIELLRAFHVDI
jgi:hypothetical protein